MLNALSGLLNWRQMTKNRQQLIAKIQKKL